MNYVASGYCRSGYVIEDSDTISGITFDKHGLFIYISPLIASIDISVIRSRHVDWLDVEENDKMEKGIRYSGYDPIPTGFTGATFFMINGWRLVYDSSTTSITGVLYSENYDTAYWTRDNDIWKPQYPVTVSAVVNTVIVDGGSSTTTGLTPEQEEVLDNININTTDIPTAVETSREVWSTKLPLAEEGTYPSDTSYPSDVSYPIEGV